MDTATTPTPQATDHYDADYFAWQIGIGRAVARATVARYAPYITPTDHVVDFGCGGGFLLAALDCAQRRGIEVNPVARADAQRRGVVAVPSASDIPEHWADVVISNSALEHVESPLAELRALYRILRPGGRLVVVVPHETMQCAWDPQDINQHLYTWSRSALGNLIAVAGFEVDQVTALPQVWPPGYRFLLAAGPGVLQLAARLYRALRVGLSPLWPLDCDGAVLAVAHRPETT